MPDPLQQVKAGFVPIRLPGELTLAGAARLIGDGSKPQAARRMMNAAAVHGIDLSLMWGTVDRGPEGRPVRVREVCLAVPGSGRTAVLLVGEPSGAARTGQVERVACIGAASEHLKAEGATVLVQTLPEPTQAWAVEAFTQAGFQSVGELAYLRRGVEAVGRPARDAWPPGISVRNVRALNGKPTDEDRALLIAALDRTYEDTLDCPELCGLRGTADVLDSHRSSGEWNSSLWWLVMLDGVPHGCMLFNRMPEQGSVELVYLGLSPQIRGHGLGSSLLTLGLSGAIRTAAGQVTCAVDLRNAPARRLYERFGFKEFGRRIAMVRPL